MKKQTDPWKLEARLKRMGLVIWFTETSGHKAFTQRKDYLTWGMNAGHIKEYWLGCK